MSENNSSETAVLFTKGLQQFEAKHSPRQMGESIVCFSCDTDFPCDRMLQFLLLQGVAGLAAMVPTGNMANVMRRFTGGN